MPGMDGIQTARAIMDTGCTTPIVALTANVIMGQAALFEQNGFSGFLSKPIDVTQLNMYLLKFIRDKYPAEAAEARAAAPKVAAVQDAGISDELTKHFIRDAKNAVTSLDALINKNLTPDELKLYTITTHGMKSALANVNEDTLSKTAAELEEAGRAEDLDKITAKTAAFADDLKKTIAAFEEKLNAGASEQDTEDDKGFVEQQLWLVIEACDKYSKPAAKKALTALKEGQCSKKTLSLIDEISALLLHGEFEQAAEMAGGYEGFSCID